MIETIIALPCLIAVIGALASCLYYGLVFYSADYHLHEALICSQSHSRRVCEKELIQRMKSFTFVETSTQVSLFKSRTSLYGEVRISKPLSINIKKTVSLN